MYTNVDYRKCWEKLWFGNFESCTQIGFKYVCTQIQQNVYSLNKVRKRSVVSKGRWTDFVLPHHIGIRTVKKIKTERNTLIDLLTGSRGVLIFTRKFINKAIFCLLFYIIKINTFMNYVWVTLWEHVQNLSENIEMSIKMDLVTDFLNKSSKTVWVCGFTTGQL